MRQPFTVATARTFISRNALYGPSYEQLMRGVHMVSGEALDHGRRIQAVRAAFGDAAVLVGLSAAWAHRCRIAGAADPVHVSTIQHRRNQTHVVVHRFALAAVDIVMTPFGPATSVTRTTVDLARGVGTGHFGDRVTTVDALLHDARLPVAAVRADLAERRYLAGLRMASQVIEAARDGVDSPKETELRLLVAAAGLPEPEVQCRVRDATGRIIASLDLGWPLQQVGLEYDGAVHLEARQHSDDLYRHNRLRQAGWLVLQVDSRALRRWPAIACDLKALLSKRDYGRAAPLPTPALSDGKRG